MPTYMLPTWVYMYALIMCTVCVVLGARTICVHNGSANILKIMPAHVMMGVCVCVYVCLVRSCCHGGCYVHSALTPCIVCALFVL